MCLIARFRFAWFNCIVHLRGADIAISENLCCGQNAAERKRLYSERANSGFAAPGFWV